MSTNEEYLDSLLKTIASEKNENSEIEPVALVSDILDEHNENSDMDSDFLDEIADNVKFPEEIQSIKENTEDISDLENLLASLDSLENSENLNELDNLQETEELSNDEIVDLMAEDRDVTELLDTVEGDDELAEINDLLKRSDNNELVDDDMLALLESVSDEVQNTSADASGDFDIFAMESMEEFEEEQDNVSLFNEVNDNSDIDALLRGKSEDNGKKKVKKAKKTKKIKDENKSIEASDELDFLNGDEPKKQGFFKKMFVALLDEQEDLMESKQEELPEDDNMAILKAMEAEDVANESKGKKKGKGKGKSKGKGKGKGKDKDKEKSTESADDDEIGSKKVKTKKKETKLKNVKPVEPSKKIGIKKVVPIFITCFAFMVVIIMLSMSIPNLIELKSARNAYYSKDYETAYEELSGKELSKSDEIIFQKVNTLLQLQRKWNSYENYSKMDKKLEALNALIQGTVKYNELLILAEEYSVEDEFNNIYNIMMSELMNTYQLSEADIITIIAYEDPITYTKVLQSIVAGTGLNISEDSGSVGNLNNGNTEIVNNNNIDNLQDILVQEEDIIDEISNNNEENNGTYNELVEEPTNSQDIPNSEKELFNGEVQGNNGSILVPNDISQ